jgi:hypothetical protein
VEDTPECDPFADLGLVSGGVVLRGRCDFTFVSIVVSVAHLFVFGCRPELSAQHCARIAINGAVDVDVFDYVHSVRSRCDVSSTRFYRFLRLAW